VLKANSGSIAYAQSAMHLLAMREARFFAKAAFTISDQQDCCDLGVQGRERFNCCQQKQRTIARGSRTAPHH
jgi:hypothetical protein